MRTSPFTANLSDVAYVNGNFVAVGQYGTILMSSDGVVWTPRTSGTIESLSGVTYGNGTFVAVGQYGTILTSPDGVTWTPRTAGTAEMLSGVTYGNGTFVTAGGGTILQSDPVSGTCTATLSSDLALHVPIIKFNDSYIRGDAVCESAEDTVMCRVTGYEEANAADFADCQASTLTSDLKLHLPAGIYNYISYQAHFEFVPSTDGQLWFKLISAVKN